MELLRAGNSVIVAMIHSAMTRVVSPKATPKDDVHVLLLMVQSAHPPRVCVAVLNANFLEVKLSVPKQLIAVKAQSVMEGIQFVQELEHHLITLFVKRKAEHV